MSSLNHSRDDVHQEKIATKFTHGGPDLSRQITLQLNADQYERLFFQPTPHAKGDLAKRFGDPTLLGLLGFLIPLCSTVFSLLHFQGSSPQSLLSTSGAFYMYGGIAMIIAGIGEFILGNTLPFTTFIIFGVHMTYLGFLNDPLHNIAGAYTTTLDGVTIPGALSPAYNAGQGNYSVVMTVICFVFLCASVRTNVPSVILFLTLIFLFGFLAAGYYSLAADASAAGFAHATSYLRIAGGFGFVGILAGFYLALITSCASTGVPCPLPVFDLSAKVFPPRKMEAVEVEMKREDSGAGKLDAV